MGRPKDKSVWRNFRIHHDKTVQCTHCDKKYKIGNVNRMAQHLLSCLKSPITVQNEIKQKKNSLQISNNTQQETIYTSKQNNQNADLSIDIHPLLPTNFTEQSINPKTNLAEKLANAIIVSGAPFSILEHPLWNEFFKDLDPSFNPPSRKCISETYLERVYKKVRADVKKELEKENYMHLQCDSLSSMNNGGDNIINIIISNPNPFFVERIDTKEHRNTVEYISEEIIKIIKIYGEQQMCTLIGDYAHNIQKALELVKLKYSHIEILNCVAHTLDLLCHDVMRPDVIKATMDMVSDIVRTFKKSKILNKLIKDKLGQTMKMPCETKWGSHFKALQSLKNNKTILQSLVMVKNLPIPSDIKSHLLDNSFWILIDQCYCILKPISEPIFKFKSNDCNIQNVYMKFKDIKNKLTFLLPTISIIDDATKTKMLSSVNKRMLECVKPMHLAAYLLNPRNQGVEMTQDEDLEAMCFISKMAQRMHLNVMHDLAQYKAKEGIWNKEFIWSSVQDMNALIWWKGLCKSSSLSKVASKILSAPCISAATEGSFSKQTNMYNFKSKRILKEKAAKITFITYNWNFFNKLDCTNTSHCKDKNNEMLEDKKFSDIDASDDDDINKGAQFMDYVEITNVIE